MPRPVGAGKFPACFIYRGGDDGINNFTFGGVDSVNAKPQRRGACYFGRLANPGGQRLLIVVSDDDLVRVIPADFLVLVPAPERLNLGLVSGVTQLLIHTENYEFRGLAYRGIGKGLDDNLGADARRVAHRYADDRFLAYRIMINIVSHIFKGAIDL
jgi:hypothetical protein